jgi:hypothetical protein
MDVACYNICLGSIGMMSETLMLKCKLKIKIKIKDIRV